MHGDVFALSIGFDQILDGDCGMTGIRISIDIGDRKHYEVGSYIGTIEHRFIGIKNETSASICRTIIDRDNFMGYIGALF